MITAAAREPRDQEKCVGMACDGGAFEARHVMEASNSGVEIKIKTLDSQVYTCRVERNVSVPDLKEQVALVTGVPSGSQRLICRGKVLKDEHVLSAYEVEDGHTLHLVTRPAPPPSVSVTPTGAQSEEQESHDISSSYNTPGHISHSVLVGTFNFPDRGSAVLPEINRIFSSVLSSFRVGSLFPPTSGAENGNSAEREHDVDQIMGQRVADQPTASMHERGSESIDDLSGIRGGVGYIGTIPAVSHVRIVQQIVPNALTTMTQRLNYMEQIFAAYERAQILSSASNTTARVQSNLQSHSSSIEEDGDLAAWSSMFRRAHALLGNQAASQLLRLANQLEAQQSLETILARGTILITGMLLEQLGRFLLDLGSTALALGREPPQPGGDLASRTEMAAHHGGEPTHHVDNDDIAGNMDIHIHAGLPPFLVPRNLHSQPNQDSPSLSLNIENTRDSTVTCSDQALIMQPLPASANRQGSTVLHEHGAVGAADLPDFFRGSSSLDNGGRGVFYPLLARFQQLNPAMFSRQEGLSLDTSNSEEHPLVHGDHHSVQCDYPSTSIQAVAQNQVGQVVDDGDVQFTVGEQLTPATALHFEACNSRPETDTGLRMRSTVEQDLETSTTESSNFDQDLARPLLHVLEAPTTIWNERVQTFPDQVQLNCRTCRKTDAETSLQLKCTGQTCLDMELSNCGLRDDTCLSNSHSTATALVVEHEKRFSTSRRTDTVSEDLASDEIYSFTCRTRLGQESQESCRMEDMNTVTSTETILQDFLSTLACRKEERNVTELVSNEISKHLPLENHELGLDCPGSNAVHVLPISSSHFVTEGSKQKRVLDIGLDALRAPAGFGSCDDDVERTAVVHDRLCGLHDNCSRDDGKDLQQLFPACNRSGTLPALHVTELENEEAVSMDGRRRLKLKQSTSAVKDEDQEDSKQKAVSSIEGLQVVKRQKML